MKCLSFLTQFHYDFFYSLMLRSDLIVQIATANLCHFKFEQRLFKSILKGQSAI